MLYKGWGKWHFSEGRIWRGYFLLAVIVCIFLKSSADLLTLGLVMVTIIYVQTPGDPKYHFYGTSIYKRKF